MKHKHGSGCTQYWCYCLCTEDYVVPEPMCACGEPACCCRCDEVFPCPGCGMRLCCCREIEAELAGVLEELG